MFPNLADIILAESESARRATDPVQRRRAVQLRDLALLQGSASPSTGQRSLRLRLGQVLARVGGRVAGVRTPIEQA